MSYYRAPVERPLQTKRFLTVRDVEDVAATGCREIIHTADLIITDAARETAHDLGVAIVKPKPETQAPPPPAAAPMPAAAPAYRAAPVLNSAPPTFPTQHGSRTGEQPLVHELVRAIRNKWQPVKRRQRQLLA